MMEIRFDRSRAKHFIDAIYNEKPIEPPSPDGWTVDDMVQLAGALFAAALEQGPLFRVGGIVDPEERTAVETRAHDDMHAALEFHADLTYKIMDDLYDFEFAPLVKAKVSKMEIERVEGFCDQSEVQGK